MTLQPFFVLLLSVLNSMLMTLLLLLSLVGRVEPQALPIKVVPFPSVMVRLSLQFAVSNAVNCNLITNP